MKLCFDKYERIRTNLNILYLVEFVDQFFKFNFIKEFILEANYIFKLTAELLRLVHLVWLGVAF